MRILLLLLIFIFKVRKVRSIYPALADELEALRRNDFVAYAALHGMRLQFYEAVTQDGWILQLWRVQSPCIYDEKLSAPVIVSHGFGSSAFDNMLNLRNQSTAFVLADNGFDVWLTNFRANQFSNWILSKGKRRLPTASEYYRACWQFMADIDLPCIIDKVLSVTRQSKFYLIGHSMGATIPFAFLSQNHSYDDKLSHFAAVVPVLKFGPDTSLNLRVLLRTAPPVTSVLPQPTFGLVFGVQLAASTGNALDSVQAAVESEVCAIVPPLCGVLENLVFNRDKLRVLESNPHLNQTRSRIYDSKTPAGVTLMNVYNFATQFPNEHWSKIDYRKLPQTGFTNQEIYKSVHPPKYKFGALNVPFSLFFVRNDVFTGPKTAKEVIAELKAANYKFIDGNHLSHLDAVVGLDTRCYTMNDILLKFQEMENGRDEDHGNYRKRVKAFVDSLQFDDGCVNAPS